MRARSVSTTELAEGALTLFVMLWFLWTIATVLTAVVVPTHPLPTRLWVGGMIAFALLLATTAYMRDPAVLWQIPLQALALACLVVGVRELIFGWRSLAVTSAAICAVYLASAVALGWGMRDLQRTVLRHRKPPNNRWRGA